MIQSSRLKNENSFAAHVLKEGFSSLVSNFEIREISISLGSTSLLGTINECGSGNPPLCSPYNLFCLYPKKKLQSIQLNWLKYTLNACTSGFAFPFKMTQFDRVIQLNNKPCDAITYPNLSAQDIECCVQELKKTYPSHAIIFPRIDKQTSPELFKNLISKGFEMVPTRPIHLYHPEDDYLKRSHSKRDIGLLKKQQYLFVDHEEITEADIVRIWELYTKLFVEKHGDESPKLTLEFFRKSHYYRWYTFFGLRNPQGCLDAFFAYETQDNVMACGPLGYDTSNGKEQGLYRMLFSQSLLIAHQNKFLFNFGGGNELFKMNRGSRREIGYTAVYCHHLPLYRRLPWVFLGSASRKLTPKIFEKVMF